nr:MAG TPA: hypothetical protein [Caudoviricetes sp.]
MALDRSNRYPGRFENPTTAQPQGAFKNRTSPTAEDGSYFEADWANDMSGFFARILNVAGVTPNGTVDSGTSSQLYDAMLSATPGRLLNIQTFFTSGTYTPTPGTKRVIVEMVGGGGGGAGSRAAPSGNTSLGGSGGAGSYLKAMYTSGFSGVQVTVGSGGNGGTVSNPYASNGSASSFGSLCSAAGGSAGEPAGPSNSYPFTTTAAVVSNAHSGSGIIFATPGSGSGSSVAMDEFTRIGFPGASSQFGAGGYITATDAPGIQGTGYGSGGGPTVVTSGKSAVAGGKGANGIVIIWEYS